jgi:rod shape-determining protein MreC
LRQRDNPVLRLASPFKAAAQKFMLALLIAATFALMILGKADTVLVERARTVLADVLAPVLEFFAEPVAFVSGAVDQIGELVELRAENDRLRREELRLLQWRTVAERLEAENKALRVQLRFAPDPQLRFVTARVVGDSGGAFVRSVIVTAGARDGAAKGQAAMTADGLAGRVQEVGRTTARILLITDINSRIPVLVERTRDIAMLAGSNGDEPQLLYLLPTASPQPGDRIVTSGHGGVLPAGLPVGIVSRAEDGLVRVQPLADLHRLEYVTLVNYGLPGVLDVMADPAPAAVEARGADQP